jgi:hypothetical protein
MTIEEYPKCDCVDEHGPNPDCGKCGGDGTYGPVKNIEMKHCQFCGSPHYNISVDTFHDAKDPILQMGTVWTIKCLKCGIRAKAYTRDEAVLKWNNFKFEENEHDKIGPQ